MSLDIRIVQPHEAELFATVALDVFDHAIDAASLRAFLGDPRHHIAVAREDGAIVAFASGVDYVHPDKPREFWINEVGVAPARQGRGLGKAVLNALLAHARNLGCVNAWVLTDRANTPACALYASAGGEDKGESVMFEFALD